MAGQSSSPVTLLSPSNHTSAEASSTSVQRDGVLTGPQGRENGALDSGVEAEGDACEERGGGGSVGRGSFNHGQEGADAPHHAASPSLRLHTARAKINNDNHASIRLFRSLVRDGVGDLRQLLNPLRN